jgi:hypothetical protein
MWYAVVLSLFFMVLGSGEYRHVANERALQANAEAADTAYNFGIYAHYALNAYSTNPSYVGQIPQAALGLPSWYQPRSGLTAFVGNGHLFVFQAQPNASMAGLVLRELAQPNVIVGLDMGGTVYSPANVALMAAPVGVPDLAVVQIVI